MKKSQILTLLLAAAALLCLSTACQKTLDRSEPRPSDGGKGYVSLSFNLPAVSGTGEPGIPVIPDEPADARESYINCEINILSWAVREQDVVL